ncbi:hypothetical protein CRE_01701 [Caenorhabditis remanei]|uniref:non-specific serine/threonine protein kinase n=1 Tax=Caenorhabditis remanei TaxID=31234 RepID=E3LF01_CAERE|nr:hypothetical protein CRE_01701 [Caenorhabditis remanei]
MTKEPVPTDQDENRIFQEGEKEVVDSMYLGQVWQPIDCTIRLQPLQSCLLDGDPLGKSNLSVVLRVKCSKEYPKRKPLVELLEPRGLSNDDVRNLLNILRQRVDELEGTAVITDLAGIVSEFLTDYNPHITAGSFHDDMLANKARTEAEKKQISERKRLDTEQKELDLLEEEMRQRNAIELEKTLNGTRLEGETRIIGGRRIVVLTNIPVKRQKPCNACHEWLGFWENTQLLISEWTFRYTSGRNSSEGKKRDFEPFFQRFEQVYNDIKKLCEIKGLDQNLVEYAFVHQQKISTTPDSVLMQLFVAQKIHSSEESLLDTYELIVPKPNLLRLLAVQAICGLRYLHEASMTHKNLTLSSVWTRNSTGDCVFRFSDFGSMGPLISLSKLFSEICSGKTIPHGEDTEKENDRRRKDLFQLGSLLDQLVVDYQRTGSTYSRRVSSPTELSRISINSNSLLSKFIVKCQEAKNIDQLVEDPFLKGCFSFFYKFSKFRFFSEECQSESENIFTPFGGAMNPEGRMLSDNVIIRVIGKGGFGDVVLVRNKMDSTDYAIKRIPLNASSEKLNRKIAKEAKIFAKFSHPNMVRYYNAWSEELIPISDDSSDESSYMGAVPIPGKEKKQKLKTGKSLEDDEKDVLGGGDSLMPANLKMLAKEPSKGPEAKEWSAGPKCGTTRRSKQTTPSGGLKNLSECSSEYEEDADSTSSEIDWEAESDEEEEEESSDDSDETSSVCQKFSELKTEKSEGEDSVFERSNKTGDDDVEFIVEEKELKEVKEHENPTPRNPRILCIQMEYCDRQTLRQYIDETKNLYNNPTEVWRIFSEVLCGLNYMHGINMIHRDIKPMNIFLTSNGGVKIGDFGLATFDLMNSKVKISSAGAERSTSLEAAFSPPGIKGSEVQQTRDIGTQLYMAPELFVDAKAKSDQKTQPYNSKIDIYSAGVVLFEMFYRPLAPGMERVSTLNNLRDQIKIPIDFGKGLASAMSALARKTVESMLQKNPDLRPTAEDLLNDEDLPMHSKEDATFRTLAEKVVKRRECRMNQWLLEKQFKEDVSTLHNYRYDYDLCQDRLKYNNRETIVEILRSEFCKILNVHAFEKLHTHTLMPVSTAVAAASVRTKPAEFLDQSGLPVALPMDLRQNFVRLCVRTSTQRLKRFNFGRVYSQSSKHVHPNEKWECCVDCIGPQSSSTSLELGTFLDRRGRGRKATVVTPDRIKAVNQGIGRIAHRSIRKMAKGMKISRRLLGRIVKDKLKFICYRERKAAILSEATTKKRLERSKKLLQRTLNGEHLVTVFFDEKLFTVQAEFNPQNHRVLAETSEEDFANGKAIHQGSHPASVMVFGAAELLLVACEMISGSLPGMKVTLKIGHAQLLEAQIRHLKLSDDVRSELLDVLHIISVSDRPHSHKEKLEMLSPKIGEKAANIITKLLIPVEDNFNAFRDKVATFRKKLKVDAARVLADKAIKDLEEIVATFKFCRTEELEKISIVYDSQTCYRPRTFGDGLVFQIQVEKPTSVPNKKGRNHTVLAGGRYDSALLRERHPRDFVYEVPLCISGFGVAMDTVAQLRDSNNKATGVPKTVQCKILICSLVQEDNNNLITEKFKIAKQFWSMNMSADVFHNAVDDLESLNEHRSRNSITHILAVCNSNMEVLVKTDATTSEMMDVDSAISMVCRGSQALEHAIVMTPNGGPIASSSTPGETNHHDDHHCGTPPVASKSSSQSTITGIRPFAATTANLNVIFATTDKNHKVKEKKRFETQIKNHLNDYVNQFNSKTKIEVLVCDIPASVIKFIVGEICKMSSDAEVRKCTRFKIFYIIFQIDTLFDQLIQKHGKVDLAPLRRQLHATLHNQSTTGFGTGQIVVIFYRLADNFFRCLT